MQCKIRPFDLHNNNSFQRRRVNSVWNGTESVSYLGPKIRDLVPTEIKESESLNTFKFKIKRWVPERCLCKICKVNLEQVVFTLTQKNWFLVKVKLKYYHYHHCI